MSLTLGTSWITTLAVTAIVTGVWLLAGSLRSEHRAAGPCSDSRRALGLLSRFRRAVTGTCLCVAAAGWLLEVSWMWALALIIGGEELLESSIMIAALRDEQHRLMSRAA